MKNKAVIKKLCKGLGLLITLVIIFCIGLVLFLSIREYRPKDEEELSVSNSSSKKIAKGDSLTLLTYNVGYGANDKDHDFFMDGGKTVNTESRDHIEKNTAGISGILAEQDPDVVFLQEVDTDSKRSYYLDESEEFQDAVPGMTSAFAVNFQCDYVPYPFPETIGSVHGGIQTLNKFQSSSANRLALPVSYKWPVRLCQLKRCLLVERVPLADSDKELVLVNLHLEAYASGDAKAKQTDILVNLLQAEYEKGNYCIAGGDFNQTFSNVDTTRYPVVNEDYFVADTLKTDILPDDWVFTADPNTPTSRLLNEPYDSASPNTQLYVIDGYIVSPNVQVEKTTTIDTGFAYSDHNPVLMKVSLK